MTFQHFYQGLVRASQLRFYVKCIMRSFKIRNELLTCKGSETHSGGWIFVKKST